MTHRTLVVDDEADLLHLVAFNLKKAGFEVLTASNGTTALQQVWDHTPDLIVLDLMLPDLSGFDVCKAIKKRPETQHVPILFLTARSAEPDRIKGFELGAEDYVVKPFSPKELVLRAKALLARTNPATGQLMRTGSIRINPETRQVSIDNQPVSLTQLEFDLLRFFMTHPEKVKTREQLLKDVWKHWSEEVMDRTVDAHVKRLRAKLGEARHHLQTVRGLGYRFSATDAPPTPGA